MGFGEACLIRWGKDGLPVRKDKSILAKLVTISAPSPRFRPCLASRFLAGSQVRGSPLGQANSANPLPTPPPPPSSTPKAGLVQLPVPSNSSGARQHRQRGHGFLSSSWGQQLLLSCEAQGMPFPGSSSQEETQEQVVQIRNTSVRDCFKTKLFQASRTKDVERSAQHHSVDEPCPSTFLPGGSQHIHFTLCAHSCRWEPRVEGREGKRW